MRRLVSIILLFGGAACLQAPGEGGAAVGFDASPCAPAFSDTFDRDEIGAAWVPFGDPADTVRDVEDGSMSIVATGDAEHTFAAIRTESAWSLTEHTIEVHIAPQPSGDGDVFFGWMEDGGDRYVGVAAVVAAYLANVSGELGGDWTEACVAACQPFDTAPQRWHPPGRRHAGVRGVTRRWRMGGDRALARACVCYRGPHAVGGDRRRGDLQHDGRHGDGLELPVSGKAGTAGPYQERG